MVGGVVIQGQEEAKEFYQRALSPQEMLRAMKVAGMGLCLKSKNGPAVVNSGGQN